MLRPRRAEVRASFRDQVILPQRGVQKDAARPHLSLAAVDATLSTDSFLGRSGAGRSGKWTWNGASLTLVH